MKKNKKRFWKKIKEVIRAEGQRSFSLTNLREGDAVDG